MRLSGATLERLAGEELALERAAPHAQELVLEVVLVGFGRTPPLSLHVFLQLAGLLRVHFIILQLIKRETMVQSNPCYTFCNGRWGMSEPSMRLYCKKGCDADDVDSM